MRVVLAHMESPFTYSPVHEIRSVALDSVPRYRVYIRCMDGLTIGQLAKAGGVNLQTVRYYERRGLLAPESRTESGYRIFANDSARRIRFIKRAQELGFTLDEIRDLLSLRVDGTSNCVDVRKKAQAKLAGIDLKLSQLHSMRDSLAGLIKSCSGRGAIKYCPILESLDGEEI